MFWKSLQLCLGLQQNIPFQFRRWNVYSPILSQVLSTENKQATLTVSLKWETTLWSNTNNTVEQHKQKRQATQCDTHRKQHFLFWVSSRNNQLLKHIVWKVKSDRVWKSHTLHILHFSFSEEIKVTLSESHTLNIKHFSVHFEKKSHIKHFTFSKKLKSVVSQMKDKKQGGRWGAVFLCNDRNATGKSLLVCFESGN